jgi:hypothetical protein
MDICSIAGLLHARSAEGHRLALRGCCTVGERTQSGTAGLLNGQRKNSDLHGGAAARSAQGRYLARRAEAARLAEGLRLARRGCC